METLHKEIICPYCRIGFGAIKVDQNKIYSHLDLFWSREAGLVRNCENNELLKLHTLIIDENGNPKFDEEFENIMQTLRKKFIINPDDITKNLYDLDSYFIAFVECLNYGELIEDEENEKFDRESMTNEKIEDFYNKGISIKEALLSFKIKK